MSLIQKIKTKIRLLRRSSIKSNNKLNKINTGKGRCYASKNTIVNIDKTASINIENGVFILNDKWLVNDPFYTVFAMGENAKLVVKDSFRIYSNSRISINKNSILELGSGYINNNLNLSCFNSIKIGENVAISENVTIRDSDNHMFISSDHIVSAPIEIGNHVWIGMNVTILKGVKVGDGSVIGAGTVVTKDVPENALVVGVPGRVIKTGVKWK